MTIALPAFVEQLYQGAISAGSSIYLPTLLLEQTLPVDPLGLDSASFGDLGTLNAGLPSQLCAAVAKGTIAQPGTAVLGLSQLVLSGLAYSLPSAPPTVNGQQVTATFSLASAPAVKGLPAPQPLNLAGAFNIALSCCPSSDGTTCSGANQPTPINGTATARFTGATVTVTLTFAGDFSVVVNRIVFAAQGTTSRFAVTTPQQQGPALSGLLNAAFTASAANTMIVSAINASLAQPNVLSTLGQALTPYFQSLYDPSILSFVASLLYKAAINPSSSAYLPKVISSATNPTLEPYTVSGDWNLGNVESSVPGAANIICGGISTAHQSEIATPNSEVTLDLTNIKIAGISNAQPLPMLAVNTSVEAMAIIGQVADWPHKFVISGDFSLQVYCCPTVNFSTCSGPSNQYTGSGTFSGAIAAAAIGALMTLSTDGNELVATMNSLYLRTDPNAINPQNFLITVDITSIPAGNRSYWNQQAENLFNSPQAADAIADKIQYQINQPRVLNTLSDVITEALQGILTSAQRAEAIAHLRALQERALQQRRPSS